MPTLPLPASVSTRLFQQASALSRCTPAFRGKRRLLRQVVRALGAPGAVVDVDGLRFELDPREIIAFEIAFYGGYGTNVVDALVQAIGRDEVVMWDVGANLGAVTLPIAHRCPNVHVHAFEPSPSVLPRLRRNVSLNPSLASRVTVHPMALGPVAGEVPFYVSAEAANQGVGALHADHNTASQAVTVPLRVGDALIAAGDIPPPDVMKVDVEGHELGVLQGLEATLRDRGPSVLYEHEPYRLDRVGSDATPSTFLMSLGYRLAIAAADGSLTPTESLPSDRHVDVLATPG